MWTYSPHYLLLPSTVCDFGRMHHLNLLCVTLTQAPWLKCCAGYVLANLAALLRVHPYAAPVAHNTNPPFLALGIGGVGDSRLPSVVGECEMESAGRGTQP